jgi:hypothetical protein
MMKVYQLSQRTQANKDLGGKTLITELAIARQVL